ncbi:hypothetical protein C8J57DRAFT_1235429 [Mycena rebaudengoi]|nr:hypothetical protein C8J57DRAFT_1235429 [Mycena rebaudengoi]
MTVLADGEVTLFKRGPVHQSAWAQTTPVWSAGFMGYISGPDQYNFLSERLLKRTRSICGYKWRRGSARFGKKLKYFVKLVNVRVSPVGQIHGGDLCSVAMACARSLSRDAARSPSIPPARPHPNPYRRRTPTNTASPKLMDMWCQPMHGTLPRPHPHRVPNASSASDDTNLIPKKRVESMRSAGGWGQRNDCGEGRQASCDATPNTRHPQRRSCRAEHKRVAAAWIFCQHKRGAAPTEHEKGEENGHHKPARIYSCVDAPRPNAPPKK